MIKKMLIGFTVCLCFGCAVEKSNESLLFDEYHEIQESLINQTNFQITDEFDVNLVYNKLDDKYRYDIIIDNPKNVMNDVTALCFVEEDYEDMFPNIGVFDNDIYSLKKDYINKEEGYYKGIQLSGTCKNRGDLKLYISYYDNENNFIEYYIEVKDEIR